MDNLHNVSFHLKGGKIDPAYEGGETEGPGRFDLIYKNGGAEVGVRLVGVSPVKAPPHEESFAEWLRKGFGGELAYMNRHGGLAS